MSIIQSAMIFHVFRLLKQAINFFSSDFLDVCGLEWNLGPSFQWRQQKCEHSMIITVTSAINHFAESFQKFSAFVRRFGYENWKLFVPDFEPPFEKLTLQAITTQLEYENILNKFLSSKRDKRLAADGVEVMRVSTTQKPNSSIFEC